MKDHNASRLSSQPIIRAPLENIVRGAAGFMAFASKMSMVVALCLASAACSLSKPGLAGLESNTTLVDTSVTKPSKSAGVASTDAQVIKAAVAEANVGDNASTALAWRNPDTGSSGTIMAIDKFFGKHGQKCRGFKTTVSTFMGIAFYNGEACQINPTEWVLSWFRRSEGKS